MDIFNYIVEQCDINFISDIKNISKPQLYNTLKYMDYIGTNKEWEKIIFYITKQPYAAKSPQDAKEYLLRRLKQNIMD